MSSIERGSYSDLGEPLLSLGLHVRDDEYYPLEALVDTGFNRGLLIFQNDAAQANLPRVDRISADRMRLADGTVRPITPTFGYVRWFGQLTQMEIAVVRAERGDRDRCLIGMELLRGTDILLGASDFSIRRR
jgi:predicted aspartyl protease